jgi:hypothetical protein
MPEIGTSGSMSGDGKRSVGHRPQATAPCAAQVGAAQVGAAEVGAAQVRRWQSPVTRPSRSRSTCSAAPTR